MNHRRLAVRQNLESGVRGEVSIFSAECGLGAMSDSYDAVIIGSGPNGLAAAITLARAGRQVLVIEAKDTLGGCVHSAELTLPGFRHDICSAVYPLAVSSPFFSALPLDKYGLQWIHSPYAVKTQIWSGATSTEVLRLCVKSSSDRRCATIEHLRAGCTYALRQRLPVEGFTACAAILPLTRPLQTTRLEQDELSLTLS